MRIDQDRSDETTSMYANRLVCESTCMRNDRHPSKVHYFLGKTPLTSSYTKSGHWPECRVPQNAGLNEIIADEFTRDRIKSD